ncbi:MAG: hypothetical protein CSB49_02675 [Proteobacteria bacterium]|nr:MAG: hypothetical protein CSB49_02675 [Pseudomonadota bacterium]
MPARLIHVAAFAVALCVAAACPGGAERVSTSSDAMNDQSPSFADGPTQATALELSITTPARGATLKGDPALTVKGSVIGPATAVTLNGAPVSVASDGSFNHAVQAVYGMNVLILEATDDKGEAQKLVQSFYYSTRWLQTDPQKPSTAMLDSAVRGWLGASVFESGGARIDIATVIERVLQSIDIASLIPSSQRINNVVGCDHADITISNVSFSPGQVALTTSASGLGVKVRFANLKANVKAKLSGKWFNPACLVKVSGKVKASAVEVTTTLDTKVSGGKLTATAKGTAAKVKDFDIDISGIWGFLTNWLVNRFEDDLARDLESMVKSEIDKQVGPALASGIDGLAFNEVLEIQPLVGNQATSVTLASTLGELKFEAAGARYALDGTAVAQPVVTHPSLGSLGYACGGAFGFTDKSKYPMQLAIGDDLLNQLLYSLHRGGLLKIKLDKEEAGKLLATIGNLPVTDLQGELDALLPPVINTCQSGGPLLQIGDLRAKLAFKLIGQPAEIIVHLAVEAPLTLRADGARIKLSISKPSLLEIESKDITAGGSKVFKAVQLLLEATLVPQLIKLLEDRSISVPIPELDLQQMDASLPAGTKVRLKVSKIVHRDGYTVAQGSVE